MVLLAPCHRLLQYLLELLLVPLVLLDRPVPHYPVVLWLLVVLLDLYLQYLLLDLLVLLDLVVLLDLYHRQLLEVLGIHLVLSDLYLL